LTCSDVSKFTFSNAISFTFNNSSDDDASGTVLAVLSATCFILLDLRGVDGALDVLLIMNLVGWEQEEFHQKPNAVSFMEFKEFGWLCYLRFSWSSAF